MKKYSKIVLAVLGFLLVDSLEAQTFKRGIIIDKDYTFDKDYYEALSGRWVKVKYVLSGSAIRVIEQPKSIYSYSDEEFPVGVARELFGPNDYRVGVAPYQCGCILNAFWYYWHRVTIERRSMFVDQIKEVAINDYYYHRQNCLIGHASMRKGDRIFLYQDRLTGWPYCIIYDQHEKNAKLAKWIRLFAYNLSFKADDPVRNREVAEYNGEFAPIDREFTHRSRVYTRDTVTHPYELILHVEFTGDDFVDIDKEPSGWWYSLKKKMRQL